jgi:acylphosphatase
MDRSGDSRDNEANPVSKLAVYSGRVQGVGFRYTAEELARGHAVSGYVRNLPEGTVEVLAEGPGQEVDAFLRAIERRMGDYIRNKSVQDVAPTGTKGFRTRY